VITNSLLINNYASASGGGLYVSSLAAPVLRQVTLYKNIAANGADIFTTIFSQTSVFSSIIWNPTRGKPARSYNSSQLNINNSLMSDLTGISGAGNLNTDPYFVNPVDFDGADNLFMTADDGLRLSETSPALTAGLAAGMPMADILGVPRTAPPDMGAYQGGFVAELAPLVIEDLVVGSGATATLGNKITVHYTGQLIDGTVFDSSYDRGEPFSLTLGTSQVIPGWEQGLQGMKVGGRRKLTIPSYLAYGSSAVGIIPPDSTLVFEVELVSIP
jgi:hypothetical protein